MGKNFNTNSELLYVGLSRCRKWSNCILFNLDVNLINKQLQHNEHRVDYLNEFKTSTVDY